MNDSRNNVPPLTDEEILRLREDLKKSEAFNIVFQASKRIGGIALSIIAAYFVLVQLGEHILELLTSWIKNTKNTP